MVTATREYGEQVVYDKETIARVLAESGIVAYKPEKSGITNRGFQFSASLGGMQATNCAHVLRLSDGRLILVSSLNNVQPDEEFAHVCAIYATCDTRCDRTIYRVSTPGDVYAVPANAAILALGYAW